MCNIINIFSFDLDVNDTSKLEKINLLLEIQNSSKPIQLNDDIALEIDTNPYNIQLLLVNGNLHVEKQIKFADVNITEALHKNADFHSLLALFIKYIATVNNNRIIHTFIAATNNKAKKKALSKKHKSSNSIVSTNYKIASFSLDKTVIDGKVRFRFKYNLPDNTFFKIPNIILRYIGDLKATSSNIKEIDMKSIFNKKLESYTLEANKSSKGIDEESKKKLYPLTLYDYQEHTVNWIVRKETRPFEEVTLKDIEANPLKYMNKLQLGYIYLNNKDIMYNTITNYIMSTKTAIDYIYSEHLKYKESLENGNIHGYNGIIAEDMSLGKTVEIISAIILNKLTDEQIQKYNEWRKEYVDNKEEAEGNTVKNLIKSNLVVCTDMILKQWVSSFNNFSGTLNYKVFHYTGFKNFQKDHPKTTLKECAEILSGYDIVITSYSVLKSELPYVEYAENKMNTVRRTRTKNQKAFDYSSPLCSVTFLRAIFDESQSLSQASLSSLASISRIHTWAISATPLKYNNLDKNINELTNLLKCLQIHPFDFQSVKVTNSQVIQDWVFDASSNKSIIEDFVDVIVNMDIARRHTREYVQSQLNIPSQHKFLLPVYLTPIEREIYNQVYETCFAEVNDGRYYTNDVSLLNSYLTDLTIMCMAGLGIHDYRRRNALFNDAFYLANQKHNPEDSMSMILTNLIEANKRALALEVRRYIDLFVQRSRYLIEKEGQYGQSEPILLKALEIIDENNDGKDHYEEGADAISLSLIRHSVLFFLGDCYYNLGLQAEKANDLDLKKQYEKKENHFYEEAAAMRKTILQEQIVDVEESMADLKDDEFKKSPEMKLYDPFFTETMEETFIINIYSMAFSDLNSSTLNLFMDRVKDDGIKVDQEDDENEDEDFSENDDDDADDDSLAENNNSSHENDAVKLYTECKRKYEEAVEIQDSSVLTKKRLMDELKMNSFKLEHPFAERHLKVYFLKAGPLLTAIQKSVDIMNKQVELMYKAHDEIIELLSLPIMTADTEEKEVDPENPSEYEKSLEAQEKISKNIELIELILANRKFILTNVGTHRFTVPETFKDIEEEYFITDIKDTWHDNYTDFLNHTAISKSLTWKSVEMLLDSSKLTKDLKLHEEWKEKLKSLIKIFNKKISYFKSLQQISDKVIDLDYVTDHDKVFRTNNHFDLYVAQNEASQRKLKSKDIYLSNLAALQKGEDNKCLICLGYIETGSILECGHRFCRDCIQHWLRTSSVCALCKMPVSPLEVHDFYIDINPNAVEAQKPKDDVEENEEVVTAPEVLNGYKIYDYIKNLSRLKVPDSKHGSKVNTLLRLLKFIDLKDEDSGITEKSQIIIYTRFPKIIPLLEKNLTDAGFRCIVALDNKMKGSQIDDFKKDRDIRVLIMTTNDNAGLTLVNANVLVLFDPILQNSVESQAINRISRIGQTRETYVFNFVTMNTVEENIIRYKEHLLKQTNSVQISLDTAASTVNSMTKTKGLKRSRNGTSGNSGAHALNIEFLKNCLFNDFKNGNGQ